MLGREGLSSLCQNVRASEEVEWLVNEELALLVLLTSCKNAPPSQTGELLGLEYNTIQGAFILLPDKAVSLARVAAELAE